MDDHEYLELERLKKENRYLRKELDRYKNIETNNPIENFLNENIEILIKTVGINFS